MSLGKRIHAVMFPALLAATAGWAQAAQHKVTLIVENPTPEARLEEVLEVSLAQILARLGPVAPAHLAVQNVAGHQRLPVQLDNQEPGVPPDRLLILVSLEPRQTIRLAISEEDPSPPPKPLVFGRVVPERKDDFAWENDKGAHRVYGPALQATGEITSGIDVWSKRVPDLVVNNWYTKDAEGQRAHNPVLSYHKDTGQGLDSYDVGSTRGCGGTGLWNGRQLFVSKNYVSAELLASGPIRLRFRLRYAPWPVGGVEGSEEKIVTLDAGSHLNRIESTITLSGASTAQWAAGLAMHQNAHLTATADGGILSVWEPLSDPSAGMDGTAIVLPPRQRAATAKAAGNALVLLPVTPGVSIVYYAGAAWSKADMPDETAWNSYLQAFRERLEHPLTTRWE